MTPVTSAPANADSNQAPQIISTPVELVNVDEHYFYPLAVFDPDGDELSLSLLKSPEGIVLEPIAGFIHGRGMKAGSHQLLIRVEDEHGAADEQVYSLNISENPVIYTSAPGYTFTDYPYRYQVGVIAHDGTSLHFTLDTGPAGMKLNKDNGQLDWETPLTGSHDVVLRVTSRAGNSVTESYTLTVLQRDSLVITSRPELSTVAGRPYRYSLSSLSMDGTDVSYALRNGPPGMTLTAQSGIINWLPQIAGNYHVEIQASASDGRHTTQAFNLSVLSLQVLDGVFRGIVSSMFEALINNDITAAAAYFAAEVRHGYLPVLAELSPYGEDIAGRLGTLQPISIVADHAEYLIPRIQAGDNHLYIVSFVLDFQGEWKIHSL